MKKERRALVDDQVVQAMKSKFGRAHSGNRRQSADATGESDCIKKTKREEVRFF